MTDLSIARGFKLPLDVLTEATAIVATRGAGKSSASAVIIEEAFASSVQTVVFDRTGVYWGLRSNSKGDGPGLAIYVLGGPQGDVPLEHTAGSMIADLVVDSGHSFVLDFSDFSKAQAIRFTADFVEHLYDRKARNRTTVLVVLDEAHFYAPQTPRGGFKGDSARLMGALEDAVGLGRSRGLGVIITTQRTQAVNKAILDLIETLIVMRMLSPRARNAVKEWIKEKHEEDEEGVIPSLEELPTGTAWFWSPLRGILRKVALRRIRTFDSYYAPKPGEAAVQPAVRKELDLKALGEDMRSTAERAEANDPAKLRKKIAELQKELDRDQGALEDVEAAEEAVKELEQELEAARSQVKEPEIVEVPMLDPETEELLRGLGTTMTSSFDDLIKKLEGVATKVQKAMEPAVEEQRRIRQSIEQLRGQGPVSPPPRPRSPRSNPIRPSDDQLKPQAQRPDVDGAPLSNPQLRILDAIVWFESIKVPHPKRNMVAAVAGVSSRSSGYKANVSTLSGRGCIAYPAKGLLQLTALGRSLATPPDEAVSLQDLHLAVYGMISGPQSTLLRELVQAWPDGLSRERLAELAGVSSASSGYKANVSTLSGLELVTYPGPGYVAASPLLFPDHLTM